MNRPLFVIALLLARSGSAGIGFQSGNEMNSFSIAGDVSLTCAPGGQEQTKTVNFQCRTTVLFPQEYDYFVGPTDSNADEVELTVTRFDGTIRFKKVGYAASKGISEARFNLWIDSIFQKPLLSFGENKVAVRLLRLGQVIRQLNFIAKVKVAGFKQCSAGQFYSNSASDCNQPYSFCQRFFQEKNYCQNIF